MVNKKLLNILDKAAYSSPGVMPDIIVKRADMAVYRVYFRYMVCIYKLYQCSALSADELSAMKKKFIADWETYALLSDVHTITLREWQKFEPALMACCKNSDNCELCKAVSHIRGAIPEADAPDIVIPAIKEG